MALPPQLIGIKRRRYDEPVDVLYLDQDRSSIKRRFTEYVFQRLKPEEPQHPNPHHKPAPNTEIQERVRSVGSHTTGGAPLVRATSPGAEIRHAVQRRAVRAGLLEQQRRSLSSESDNTSTSIQLDGGHDADEPARMKGLAAARRFRLSRHNLTLTSRHIGGIQKHKRHNRAHLATFVEMHVSQSRTHEQHSSRKPAAVDRLVDDARINHEDLSDQNDPTLDQTTTGISAAVDYSPQGRQPFVKAPKTLAKTGNSIRDHPCTWDYDSTQLADELAAFALEVDGGDHAGKTDQHQLQRSGRQSPGILDTDVDVDDIHVYETYLRIRRTELPSDHEEKRHNLGMLVIEEQDEELWQTFAEDEDEDSEWDEEDGDSNAEDNPRNDYPEEEASSEDERGHGAYKFRHDASDDEEYDVEDPFSSEDGSAGL